MDKKKIKEFAEWFSKINAALDQRYKECDSKGHVKPEGNYCNYCYRHLEYSTPQTDAISRERSHLPLMQQPMDASIMMEKRRKEIYLQKSIDRSKGIGKISEELREGGELEKKLN